MTNPAIIDACENWLIEIASFTNEPDTKKLIEEKLVRLKDYKDRVKEERRDE